MNGAFQDMAFISSMDDGLGNRPETPRTMDELNKFYAAFLAGIIGDYHKTRVRFLNLSMDSDRDAYEEILNDPGCRVVSQEGEFSVTEFRDKETYSKETGYHMLITYDQDDYLTACDRMKKYVDSLKHKEPKINNPGGMIEILRVWESFVESMPVSERPHGAAVTKMISDFVEELTKANTIGMTSADKEAEEFAKKAGARYTLSDKLDPGDRSDDSESGTEDESDKVKADEKNVTADDIFGEEEWGDNG